MRKLNKEILSLALPSILANITVPLVGMVDIAVAGHLNTGLSSLGEEVGGSAAALIGGITIGTMLFDLLYWNFAFLRAGTGGITAQAYGRKEGSGQIGGILHRALRISILSGLVLIALQWAVLWLAFMFLDVSPAVKELSSQYFQIRIWAAPATLSLFAFKGWFIGLQDTVRPMIADLLVNGINIALSVCLGFGLLGLPQMGFAGIAVGTLIAQWSGFIYAAVAAHLKVRSLPVSDSVVSESEKKSFFNMNRDLVLRSLGMIAVYIGFTVISSKFGDTMLAVSSILMKLLLVFSYFTDGFAYAGEALTGRFIGAGDSDGVHAAIKGTFLWGITVAAVFMLLYGFGGVPMLRMMTSDAGVVDAGRQFIPWLLLMPMIGVPAFIWDGIFIGATASRDLRNSTLLCAVGFFGVWALGVLVVNLACGTPVSSANLAPATAIHILMAAYFAHLAIRSVYLTARSRVIFG